MKKITRIVSLFILWAVVVSEAQSNWTNDFHARVFSVGLTSDSFAGIEIGYMDNTDLFTKSDFGGYLRFGVPFLLSVGEKSIDSWEAKAGIRSELFRKSGLGIIGDLQLYLIHHNQILGRFIPCGVDVCVVPCYHFRGSYIGLQISWNQTVATYISHSEYVKDTYTNLSATEKTLDIHPRDGWYNNTGSQFRFGVECGWDTSQMFTIQGEIGLVHFNSPYTGLFDAMMIGQVPFYGNLRLLFKF